MKMVAKFSSETSDNIPFTTRHHIPGEGITLHNDPSGVLECDLSRILFVGQISLCVFLCLKINLFPRMVVSTIRLL
jgi:hypothetical protein